MRALVCFMIAVGSLVAQGSPAKPVAGPAPERELLRYTISWATGLSLGEAQISSKRIPASEGDSYEFTFQAEAAIPKFPLAEWTRGAATLDLCTTESEKKAVRGVRKVDEKTTFEHGKMKAVRETLKGGKSTVSTGGCPRDAITYLYFLRRELANGRLPKVETVYYGAAYQVTPQFVGNSTIRRGEEMVEAERINLTIKGPSANVSAEAYFAKDSSRKLLLVRIPVAAGAIAMELEP